MNVSVERLRHLGKNDLAEELSGQYQGDIIISPEQLMEYRSGNKGKTGLIDTSYRWSNNEVPYEIVESYFSNLLNRFDPFVLLKHSWDFRFR
jgi:hypothetical protein